MAATLNSPRDGSRIPAVLAKDTVSAKAVVVSGILAGSTEGLAVAIIDGSGAQITSFGGGTQYTDAAAAPTHPIGTGIIFNNGGTFNFVSAAQPLPITGSLSITNPSTGSAVPATANYIAGNKAGNLTGVLFGSQTTTNSLAVALASDQVAIPVTLTSTTITGTVGVTQSTSPWVVSNGGTFAVQAGQSGTWTVGLSTAQTLATVTTVTAVTAITNALPAGTNNIGAVTPTPTSNSGWLFKYNAGGFTNTKVQLKGTAGTFGGYVNFYNPNTTAAFVQVFNKASASVTVGSTTPDFVLVLPGVASASATGSAANVEIGDGIAMGTGITVAVTTTETGSSALANNVFITFLYI